MALTKDLTETVFDNYKATLGEAADEVVVGNEKVTFAEILPDDTVKEYIEPTIEFTKWNREESLKIVYPDTLFTDKTITDGEVGMTSEKEGFYFKQPSDTNDIVKFGLILYEVPKVKKWTFKLQGWENYNFEYNYIHELDPELHPEKVVSETDEYWEFNNNHGGRTQLYKKYWKGYNVYHKTKKNHVLGQTNYKFGRFCKIHPPILRDADGGEIGKADLVIENGMYSLSIENVSEEKLKSAKLPIVFNDTFGYSDTDFDSSDSTGGGYWYAMELDALAPAGTLTNISCYNAVSSSSSAVNYGLYTGTSGGDLTSRVYDASTWTHATAANWYTNPVAYSFTLVEGTQYWVLAWSAGTITCYCDNGGSKHFDYGYSSTALDSGTENGDAYWTSKHNGVYATYTAGGGGSTFTLIGIMRTVSVFLTSALTLVSRWLN